MILNDLYFRILQKMPKPSNLKANKEHFAKDKIMNNHRKVFMIGGGH